MPTTARYANRIFRYLAAALVVVGLLVITVVALSLSLKSSSRSADTARCVNTVLGERAEATNIEQDARYRATVAELRYLQGNGSKRAVIDTKTMYVHAQEAAAAYRKAHPAGRC